MNEQHLRRSFHRFVGCVELGGAGPHDWKQYQRIAVGQARFERWNVDSPPSIDAG